MMMMMTMMMYDIDVNDDASWVKLIVAINNMTNFCTA